MIRAIRGDTLTIEVFGEIFSWSGEVESEITAALRAHIGPVRVLINSEGGDVTTGLALNALLRARDTTTINIGQAASAGSVIFASGKRRLAALGSVFMLHESWAGSVGNADQLEEAASMLRAYDAGMAEVYAATLGKPVSEVEQLMSDTTWLSSSEALALGLATAIAEPEQAAARVLSTTNTHGSEGKMKTIRERLGLPATATEEQVAQALDAALAAAANPKAPVGTPENPHPVQPGAPEPQPAPVPPSPGTPQPAPQPEPQTDDLIERAVARALAKREQSEAHAQACVAAVERFIAEGKIAPAGRAAAVKACGDSAASLSAVVAYWESAPRIIGGVNLPAKPQGNASRLTAQQQLMCKAARISEEQFLAQEGI